MSTNPLDTNARNVKERILNILAFLISVAFSPYLLSVLFFVIISFLFANNLESFIPALLIGLIFIVVIPIGFSLWQLETKKISDIHLAVHEQRKIPFTVSAVSSIIGVIILYCLKVPDKILVVAMIYTANVIVTAIITWKWKISIHATFLVSSVLIIMFFWGAKFWPLFFLLIPVAWARIYRKRHTPMQILVGAVLSFIVTYLVFHYFGYKLV
jgi:membrane-associated phospholipid phosphatase